MIENTSKIGNQILTILSQTLSARAGVLRCHYSVLGNKNIKKGN